MKNNNLKKNINTIITSVLILVLTPNLAFASDKFHKDNTNKQYLISAYYSPLPNQQNYVTGSLAGDKRLNGNGTNGADGTEVYIGMIAAPRELAFGTKLNIEGMGIGTVHDRGGAIIKNGKAGYPRLDVWMGHGDEGLKRALSFGKQVRTVRSLGVNRSVNDNLSLGGVKMAKSFKFPTQQKTVTKKVLVASKKPVKVVNSKLMDTKKYLKELGFYNANVNDVLDADALNSINLFTHTILGDKHEYKKFEVKAYNNIKAYYNLRKNTVLSEVPKQPLQYGDSNKEVKKLQTILFSLGFDVEINGLFDKATFKAIKNFQLKENIIFTHSDIDAGYYGKNTADNIKKRIFPLRNRQALFETSSDKVSLHNKSNTLVFNNNLQRGQKGKEVSKLQQELKNLNFLAVEPTGIYGSVTENAVLKFQQSLNIVSSKYAKGAGVFGPSTRESMNAIIRNRRITKDSMIAKAYIKKDSITKNKLLARFPFKKIIKTYNPGENNSEIRTLQTVLGKLGYFEGKYYTEFYGPVTKKALVEFQLEQKLIVSKNSRNAGVLDTNTLKHINSMLSN